jgi:hypothetical protein
VPQLIDSFGRHLIVRIKPGNCKLPDTPAEDHTSASNPALPGRGEVPLANGMPATTRCPWSGGGGLIRLQVLELLKFPLDAIEMRTTGASQSATQIKFSRKLGKSRTEGHLGELAYK